MRQGGCLLFAGLILTLDVGGAAARPAHGLTFAGEQAYVAAVEIVQHDAGAPPALYQPPLILTADSPFS